MTILTLNEILYFGKIAGICLLVANNPKLLTLKVSVSVSGSPIFLRANLETSMWPEGFASQTLAWGGAVSLSAWGRGYGYAPPTGAIFLDPGGAVGCTAPLGKESGLQPGLRASFRGKGTGGQGREEGKWGRQPEEDLAVPGSPQHASGSFLLAHCLNLKRSPSSFYFSVKSKFRNLWCVLGLRLTGKGEDLGFLVFRNEQGRPTVSSLD